MHDHEIRWYTFITTAIIMAFLIMLFESSGIMGDFPARPEWLWCLAFYAVLRTPGNSAIIAFFFCGLVRDLYLGPRMGSATIAYTLIGWITLYWRPLAASRGWFYQPLIAGASAILVSLLKHALDYGPLTYKLMERWIFLSLADGILTGIVYLPLTLLLGLESLRPWKEKSVF